MNEEDHSWWLFFCSVFTGKDSGLKRYINFNLMPKMTTKIWETFDNPISPG